MDSRRPAGTPGVPLAMGDERFHATLDSLSEGCQLLDFEWRYLYLNSAAEQHNRRPNSELLGRTMLESWPGMEQTEVYAALMECMTKRVTVHTENEFQFPNGASGWFDIRVHPVPEGIFILSIDISARKRTEADRDRLHTQERAASDALAATTVQLRQQAELLDRAKDAILVRDLEHRVRYWNRSAERLYGWTAAETKGRSVLELMYPSSEQFSAAMKTLLERGEWSGEITQRTRGGQMVTVEGQWTLLRDPAGAPNAVLAINTDITQRKKLEQQFLRAQRMESIGTLAGGIAHDLNNILAPITLAVGMLEMSVKGDDAELVELIRTSSERGANLVRQVLTFARGTDGARLPIKVADQVSEIIRIAKDTFPKHITIDVRMADALWGLSGDPTQIHQVLLNLCVNARDAMPDGGTIAISAENVVLDDHYAAMNLDARVGNYVRIDVEDTGSGIPANIIDKIFDPFFTTKELGKGSGLGLSTSQSIVRSHGGFINVYSDPGLGTRFRVYLPELTTGTGEAPEPEPVELPRGDGQTILVVDDETAIRQITRQTLEAYGYKVILAVDGAEAVFLFEQQRTRIALVVTDMMMPVMDGVTTVRHMRSIDPSVRIIGVSGLDRPDRNPQGTPDGVNAFLEKPYTAATLLTAIHRLLYG